MGLPIKHRKKYISHKKRWNKETILEEEKLVTDYALKNKQEIRKVEFKLGKLKKLAKEFNKSEETKNSKQAQNFIEKLKGLGYLSADAESLDSVLDITVINILERRLSNLVYKHKFSKTPQQARQFVVHRHVKVGGKVIDSPSAVVSLADEVTVEFTAKSPLSDEQHPERSLETQGLKEEIKKQEEIPEKEEGPNTDELEAKFDDEEAPEVVE